MLTDKVSTACIAMLHVNCKLGFCNLHINRQILLVENGIHPATRVEMWAEKLRMLGRITAFCCV